MVTEESISQNEKKELEHLIDYNIYFSDFSTGEGENEEFFAASSETVGLLTFNDFYEQDDFARLSCMQFMSSFNTIEETSAAVACAGWACGVRAALPSRLDCRFLTCETGANYCDAFPSCVFATPLEDVIVRSQGRLRF